jgi:aspartyl-tRNA(Asn)/glutamyl-tRNA(Gln) amidotransferase subunit A
VSAGPGEGELETAAEMAAAHRAGDVAAAELVERTISRAEAWQPSINAFSQLWADRALDRARRIDDGGWAQGEMGLAGVPLAVKDLFDVAGQETSGCCAAYRGTIATRDAPMIERAERQGLVIVGKTNQHELAAGGTNLVSACGRPGNPWDPARMTGGSSGGSAAVVATGIVPWSFGSDTGGSIRIPSSMCGTFGLKPTTGKLSIQGMLPLGPSLDCPGPMASTAGDLRLAFGVMTGAASTDGGEAPTGRDVTYRIGLPDGLFADVHPETAAVVEHTAMALERQGIRVESIDGRGLEDARQVWMDVCCPEFTEAHPLLKDPQRRALVNPAVQAWLEHGERLGEDARARARARREEIGRWFRERLAELDALLIPTTPYPAPPPDDDEVELLGSGRVTLNRVGPGWITCSVNLAGLPALNLPAGRSSHGLPIGVSLVGHDDQEALLLSLASIWQLAVGYQPERPKLSAPR